MIENYNQKYKTSHIDLHYYRSSPRKKWMRILILLNFLVIGAWLAYEKKNNNELLFMPGHLNNKHKIFEKNCQNCHIKKNQYKIIRNITNEVCLKCHSTPLHINSLKNSLLCTDCHNLHKKGSQPATDNIYCIKCHKNLSISRSLNKVESNDSPVIEKSIKNSVTDFNLDHPGFRAINDNTENKDTIYVNHKLHMDKDLIGANNLKGQVGVTSKNGNSRLTCLYCHRLNDNDLSIEKISFQEHCSSCHEIRLDKRVPGVKLPHININYLTPIMRSKYSEFVINNPKRFKLDNISLESEKNSEPYYSRLPKKIRKKIDRQVDKRKKILLQKICALCHKKEMQPTKNGLTGSKTTSKKPKHSKFSHKPHILLKCGSCHEYELNSKTADIQLPGIQVCKKCHFLPDGASTECVECHEYHNKPNKLVKRNSKTIDNFMQTNEALAELNP